MSKIIVVFLLLILPFFMTGRAANDQGYPSLRNFSPAVYKGHTQNFAVVSDRQGLVYVGNFAGVLQFDGQEWRLIPTGKITKVSALAVDPTGSVFVGALNEIGFLAPDKKGELRFNDLLGEQSTGFPAFGEVKNILITSEEVSFICRNHILSLRQNKISCWNAPSEITGSWLVNGEVWLQMETSGLVSFSGEQIKQQEEDLFFANAIAVKAILPYTGNGLLIATGTQGLFLLENGKAIRFDAPVNSFLQENTVTCGISLSDGSYAIGTSRGGVVIIDKQGEIVQRADRKALLQDDFVQALYASDHNTVWAALNNGISLIEAPSPFSLFDEESGLEGEVMQTMRINGILYVATYQGLYYFVPGEYRFKPVEGITSACWSILPLGEDLLAATSQGVYLTREGKGSLIKAGFALSLTGSADPSVAYAGETRGFYSLRRQGMRWISREIAETDEEIRELKTGSGGMIWGTTLSGRIFSYVPGNPAPVYYSTGEGLPVKLGNKVFPMDGKMIVSTRDGLYAFDGEQHKFFPLRLQHDSLKNDREWYSLVVQDNEGSLWVNDGDEKHIRMWRKGGSLYRSDQEPFLPVSERVIRNVYPEATGIAWLGGPDGLVRYNPAVKVENMKPGKTLIRKITLGNDSVVFAGHLPGKEASVPEKMKLRYAENSLRFDFSLPFYTSGAGTLYQVWLEGFDDEWSGWSPQPQKEYTSMAAGKYIFHVRGKNHYGKVSPEAAVEFEILTPWYATVWALAFWLLLAGIAIYLIVLLRNRQLVNEKRALEQTVSERTEEIVQQKEEIESQSLELAHKNAELEKINTAVKSINAEINFENLLPALLTKMRIIGSVENSTALVFDKNVGRFRFKASIGWDLNKLDSVSLSLEEAENMFLKNENEVNEDIFIKRDFSALDPLAAKGVSRPASMMVLVIKIEDKIEAFLIFDNQSRENAFDSKDISFVRNAKEHIVSAFIRTRILEDLQHTLQNLKDTQNQLIQSEKLASLGELTAGIAHEIQNPLNFVNNFSSLSIDLAEELAGFLQEIREKISDAQYADMEEVADMLKGNVKKINEHGKRAESIVKGMLQHSRGKSGEFEMTDINAMVSEYVSLAYHGMRAKDKSFNTAIRTLLDPEVGKVSIIPQDLSRVVLNIVNNSCYALDEKTKKGIPGFSPEVVVSTSKLKDSVEIRIRDNGTGIPQHVIEKIFNPFFTTKPTGKGTGLGLSMSYDIVTKMHKGKLEVTSKEGEYTEFVITIPEKQS